jgi:transcriptional regulator with PAS, ATPase and Fis domain
VFDEKYEKDVIEEALQRHHGNRAKVAVELGMHRSTLWRKMKVYGLR